MKSRLITALAIGALAAGMLPGVASAAEPTAATCVDYANYGDENPSSVACATATDVTVTVEAGTSLFVPALINLGTAMPGEWLETGAQDIAWYTNEDIDIVATLGDLSGVLLGDADGFTINNEWVRFDGTDAFGDDFTVDSGTSMGDPIIVANYNFTTNNVDDPTDTFYMGLLVKNFKSGAYSGHLAWSVAAPQ